MLNDTSLICQFNLNHYNGLTPHLVECAEELFSLFNYKIKKIHTSSAEKVYSPSYKKFKSFANPGYFYTISFQSDYNREDFEPQTHIYSHINNFWVKGTEYALPEPLVKFTIVINDAELLKNADSIYKDILSALSEIPQVNAAGHAFLLPNTYGAVSFSHGILRKLNMPDSLQNLARWYRDSNVKKGVIGLFNCLTPTSKKQIILLKDIFGEHNVETINGITFFRNEQMSLYDIENYFISMEYNRLCDKLESEFCFLRADRFL